MLAIDLGTRIESDPSIQNQFYKWLQTLPLPAGKTILDFYHLIGIEWDVQFYQNICLCIKNWLRELALQ